MLDPVWLSEELILSIHARQIGEYGRSDGIRDRGMLESALNRPRQRLAYGGATVDLSALAASYAYGIARNHPFMVTSAQQPLPASFFSNSMGTYSLPKTSSIIPFYESGRRLAGWLRDNTRPASVSEVAGSYG